MSSNISIYVDGSTVTNPGPGAWAAVIVAGGREVTITGYEPNTTNSRVELMAAIEGLRFFKACREITVYSDSQYVVNMFAKGWIDKWAANDYKKTVQGSGALKDVKNRDLVKAIDAQNMKHHVSWLWVRGHSGNHYNEMAHQAAYDAAQAGYKQDKTLKNAVTQALEDSPQTSNVVPLRPESFTETTNGGSEGVDTPETLDGLSDELMNLPPLPPLEPIPDPPMPSYRRGWAVYERSSQYVLGKLHYLPVSPSEYPNGGREVCIAVAQKMNQTDSPIILPFGGRGKYVALPWRPSDVGRILTEEEDREIMAYMKDDGKVVSVGAR